MSIKLFTGWAIDKAALTPLAAALSARLGSPVELCDLPADPKKRVDLTEPTVLIGWSLGGQVAARVAASSADQCSALITLASNPSFVAKQNWPTAMPRETFDAFARAYVEAPAPTLKRFASLVAQGSSDMRAVLHLTRGHMLPPGDALTDCLRALYEMDTQDDLTHFRGPQLHLFAAADALVPVECATGLVELNPTAQIAVLEGFGHALPLNGVAEVTERIAAFLAPVIGGSR